MPAWPGLVLATAIVVLVLTGCGGSDDSAAAPGRALPTPTTAPPDADGDGVADQADSCSDAAERPGGIDYESPDGCPDSLDDLVAFAIADIGKYWSTRLSNISIAYYEPAVVPYRAPIPTACGPAPPDNAIYCGFDNTVYYDAGMFEREFAEHGDFAPVFTLAHEWGHVVQAHLAFFALENLYSIDYELQADCMAGVYARNADQRDLLALGDLDEAAATLLQIGDDENEVAWYDEGAHGTAAERTYAFMQGFEQGLGVCAEVANEAKRR